MGLIWASPGLGGLQQEFRVPFKLVSYGVPLGDPEEYTQDRNRPSIMSTDGSHCGLTLVHQCSIINPSGLIHVDLPWKPSTEDWLCLCLNCVFMKQKNSWSRLHFSQHLHCTSRLYFVWISIRIFLSSWSNCFPLESVLVFTEPLFLM